MLVSVTGAIRTFALALAIVMAVFAGLMYYLADPTATFVAAGFVWLATACAVVALLAQLVCWRANRIRIERYA